MRPKALAAVNEHFCLSTDGHEKDWRGENQTIRLNDFFLKLLIIILHFASARVIAGVTLDARADIIVV